MDRGLKEGLPSIFSALPLVSILILMDRGLKENNEKIVGGTLFWVSILILMDRGLKESITQVIDLI